MNLKIKLAIEMRLFGAVFSSLTFSAKVVVMSVVVCTRSIQVCLFYFGTYGLGGSAQRAYYSGFGASVRALKKGVVSRE
jgi:hypothetical protein